MIPSSADEPSQRPRVEVTGLAQAPLTRLREVRIPGPSQDTLSKNTQNLGRSAQVDATSQLREAERTFVRVPLIPATSSMTSNGFSVLQQWEGTVTGVSEDCVTAVLHDWTNPTMPDEEVTVSIDEFSPGEQPLLEPGAVFYWCIGYRTRRGTRERVSSFQLRRMPPLSKSVRDRAEKDARVLYELLSEKRSL